MKDNSVDNSTFEALFEKEFRDYPQNALFVAAVSGGADSTAMLIALSALANKRNYRVSCLHIRHNIRSKEESDADAVFVRSLCERLAIPCRIIVIKPGKIAERAREKGIGIEAAAREYRQAAFRHELKRLGAEKIIVAHNKNDVLENSLMRILRGAGPKGLASMPSSTKLIVRPLINISRKQILEYLAIHHQSYQIDASNADNHYFRNRVRNILIPVLNEHFPYWEKGLESLSETQSYAAEYLESEAKRLGTWQICEDGSEVSGEKSPEVFLQIAAERFDNLHPIMQEEVIFQGIEMLLNRLGKTDEKNHADIPRQYRLPRRFALRKFLQSGQKTMDLGKIRLERSGESLRILVWENHLIVKGADFCAETSGLYQFMGYSIKIAEKNDTLIDSAMCFSCELPIVFRFPLVGEKIPFNKSHKTKTKNAKNAIIAEDRNGKIAVLSFNGNVFLLREQTCVSKFSVSITLNDIVR
jgi:tRNA(Ile)-lysidine synthase